MSVSQLDRRIAKFFKTRRQEKKLSIRYLAEQTGLVPSTISRIESGDQKPSLVIVLQLCKYLDISAAELVAQVEVLLQVATRLQMK